ncbi:glycolate oxidase iron-sulfur subunit [Paenibacillus marchantiophytorum]|uniref:Glycolate oxidase iron-sulfur subunit n=1 Tax=Paenibacillus marchantiophytorum TaxID=1619310 RepID=A0ABQ1EY68_9BACL|nr:(Fe-S)-binding protein [Paenibacillus marchantiophytorum]GFZ91256.1 glycolate oxidase iron-sulfur subunit [Paenibacillus marchantiophytorum]
MSNATAKSLQESLRLKLDYDQLTNCMRCGFCLPACPTFKETGVEAESPRGRISLMKAAVDGIMEPNVRFEEQMGHCLGCRACEPACPADVKYGQLIEQARDAIEDHTTQHRTWVKGVRKVVFGQLFPHQNRMKLLGKGLRFYQKSGAQTLARKTGVVGLFSKQMSALENVLPEAAGKGVVDQLGTRVPAIGEKIGTVGMFRGCLMDVLFTETNRKTVQLLAKAGFDVVIPEAQNCCGALHAHSGEMDQAKQLARHNIRAFQEAGVDYIVSNAGGCGAILVEYDHLLHDDAQWQEQAKWFASRVKDISTILLEKGRPLTFTEGPGVRITYQDSCHLRNVMKAGESPRKLLKQMPGATFVEMKDAGSCCGSAGIYNLTQPDMANTILDHKMDHAKATDAHYIVTSNPGCLLQMKLGIDKHAPGSPMQAVHIVDFLYERV